MDYAVRIKINKVQTPEGLVMADELVEGGGGRGGPRGGPSYACSHRNL